MRPIWAICTKSASGLKCSRIGQKKFNHEHLVHVHMLFETLRHHKLYAKASKCQFGRSSVSFLGHVIIEHCVAVDPCKVAAVAEWATQTSCTNVRLFVCLANYYHKFVLLFSALAAQLTALCSPVPNSCGAQPISRASTRSKRR